MGVARGVRGLLVELVGLSISLLQMGDLIGLQAALSVDAKLTTADGIKIEP